VTLVEIDRKKGVIRALFKSDPLQPLNYAPIPEIYLDTTQNFAPSMRHEAIHTGLFATAGSDFARNLLKKFFEGVPILGRSLVLTPGGQILPPCLIAERGLGRWYGGWVLVDVLSPGWLESPI
jgi:hypothetical protein